MSVEAKNLLVNRVEVSLQDKLTAKDTNTTIGVLNEELVAFDVEHVNYDTPNLKDDLLDVFISTKSLENKSPKTLERYRYVINKLMMYAQVNTYEITVYNLRGFLDSEKARGLSDETLKGYRDIFVAYFNWLHKEGLIQKNPAVNLTPIKTPKIIRESFSDIEIDLLKASCKTIRDKALISFLLSTGCRISEVTDLNIKDVNFNTSEVTVFGKGFKERKVFLDKPAKYYLTRYLETRHDNNKALFISCFGKRITPGGVRAMLKILEKESGVPDVHPHKFRRTLATHLIDRGAPIQVVALILGHDKLDTTMKYIAYTTNTIKSEYNKFM